MQYFTKMLRQYFSYNEILEIFLTGFCNILCNVVYILWRPKPQKLFYIDCHSISGYLGISLKQIGIHKSTGLIWVKNKVQFSREQKSLSISLSPKAGIDIVKRVPKFATSVVDRCSYPQFAVVHNSEYSGVVRLLFGQLWESSLRDPRLWHFDPRAKFSGAWTRVYVCYATIAPVVLCYSYREPACSLGIWKRHYSWRFRVRFSISLDAKRVGTYRWCSVYHFSYRVPVVLRRLPHEIRVEISVVVIGRTTYVSHLQ